MTVSEFYTPPEVMERVRRVLGGIDLDPASCDFANRCCVGAARYYTRQDDGWGREWWGRVYLNPPSGTTEGRKPLRHWWDRLCAEYLSGRVQAAVFCAFHLTLFSYPAKYLQPQDRPFALMRKKVLWVRPDGRRYTPKATSAFVLLTHDQEIAGRFVREFQPVAAVCVPAGHVAVVSTSAA